MRRTLVPAGIILQVQLMIALGIKPIAHGIRAQNLRRDPAALPPLLLRPLRHLPRDPLLLVRVREYRRPVLRARVGALPVFGRRVVHSVQEFQQRAVGYLRRVEGYLEGFGV